MHLKNKIFKGILPLTLMVVVGLFEITGIDAVSNQKGSADSKQVIENYDYSDEADVPNGEISAPRSTVKPYFENNLITVYATKENENLTLECLPKNFNDSRHQILWYNGEHPITNGNITLSVGKYAVDNKYRLTIINYNKNTPGNFSCAVLPTDVRQYIAIEFGTPPENITHHDGSNMFAIEIKLILLSLILIVSTNYCKF